MILLKRIFTDPAFWSLLLMNVLFIYYYYDNPGTFKTYLWIYWLQSAVIGIFTFFNILTVNKMVAGSLISNGEPVTDKNISKGCISFFFLFHYEGFHFVYAIFLFVFSFQNAGNFDFNFFKIAALGIFANQIIWYVQNKFRQKERSVNLGKVFFLPYLRIIPMHLTLLIPAFFNIPYMGLFLILKTLMDVILHLITTEWYWKKEESIL